MSCGVDGPGFLFKVLGSERGARSEVLGLGCGAVEESGCC